MIELTVYIEGKDPVEIKVRDLRDPRFQALLGHVEELEGTLTCFLIDREKAIGALGVLMWGKDRSS